MEEYFDRRSKQFDLGIKNLDVYAEESLPIGLKFANNEKLPTYAAERSYFKEPNLPFTPDKPQFDPTWRYHWLLNQSNNLVPSDFPNFSKVMQRWGTHLFRAGHIIA